MAKEMKLLLLQWHGMRFKSNFISVKVKVKGSPQRNLNLNLHIELVVLT